MKLYIAPHKVDSTNPHQPGPPGQIVNPVNTDIMDEMCNIGTPSQRPSAGVSDYAYERAKATASQAWDRSNADEGY